MKMRNLALAGLLAVAGVVSCSLVSNEVYAKVTCPPGSVRDEGNSYAECNLPVQEADDPTLMGTVQQILNVIVGVVGVVAVAVIIIGGIFFVTSQGDASKVTRARNTILYGVVGLIVALLAFAIVNFVLSSVFGGGKSSGGSGSTGGGGSGGGSSEAANP